MKKKSSKKNTFFDLLDIICDTICIIIKKINKFLTDKKKSSLVKSIVRIVCAFIIVVLLEIPFFLIGELGEGILYLCNVTFNTMAASLWSFAVEYAYVLLSLIVFFKILLDMKSKKEYDFEIKTDKKVGRDLYTSLSSVLRVVIALFLIPLGLLGILLFAIFGMLVALLTHGIYVFGPIIMIVGLLIMLTFFASSLYDVVFLDKGGNK